MKVKTGRAIGGDFRPQSRLRRLRAGLKRFLGYMQGLTELTTYGKVASPQQRDYVEAIAFVPGSNSEVAIGTGDGAVKLVDVRTG
jgi:hypothetical protein